jgi:hypothetical protein
MKEDIKYNAEIPVQTVSYNDKIKNDFEWAKRSMDAIIRRSYFSTTQHKWQLKKLYDLYNGHVDLEDYKLIIEPFGKRLEGDFSNVINYPIIKPKIDLLLGEYAKRPKSREVYVSNSDVVNQMLQAKNQMVLQSLEQLFVNELNNQGVDTGVPSEEVPLPKEIEQEFNSSYRDKRAELGQNSLEYIYQYNKLDEKINLNWFHALVSGEVYSYRGVELNEPVYEVVNPLDIDYDRDPDIEFVEDGEWVARRKYMNLSSIVEYFYPDLGKTEKEKRDMINKLESLGTHTTVFTATGPSLHDRTGPQGVYNRLVEVKHVVWKSKKKIGICYFIDEFGQPQEMEVDENFKAVKEMGQEVEWLWVNEIWEGYLIGTDIYLRIQSLPMQRTSLDNLSKCKLPYNGRVFSAVNSPNVSLTMLGYPYQVLYNGVFHRYKLALAKMKDDMIMLDINLKPKNMSTEEWLLYGDATNIIFVDYTKDSYRGSSTHQNVLRMASTTIQSYIETLRFIKQEWEEVCGISRQREGQIATSETVGGVERAVVQSSLITEIYFTRYDQFLERDYQALIDYSKLAWANGKKTSFIQPDTGKIVYLDVDPIEHTEAEYGIFVALSGKQLEKRKQLESQLQNFIQNGAKGSTIIDIIDSDNFVEIKKKMLYAEQKQEEFQQQMEQMKGEQQKEIMAIQEEANENNHRRILEQIDRKGEWALRAAEVRALGIDEGDDGNLIKLSVDEALGREEINVKREQIAQKERESQRKSSVEKYKADKQLEIAKENKNKHDK